MNKIQLHYDAMKDNAANGDTEEVIDALFHTLNGLNMAFYSQEYTDKMFNILSDVVKAWGNQTDRKYDASPIEQLFHEVALAAAERIEENEEIEGSAIKWLEENQPDVFSRGLHDVL